MAIEAPVSKFKKTNVKIYIGALVLAAVVFGYDGYLSEYKWSMRYSFYQKHVLDSGGKPTSTMVFNRTSPFFFFGAAVLLAIHLFQLSNKKIVAEQNELILSANQKIPYDAIEKIDKTHFESRGFFVLTYKMPGGSQVDRKLSDRDYDNLKAILELMVAKIS